MDWGTGADRLLDGLDPQQREVATTLTGPLVVIAGAGTGKTRAITHRIAYGVATGAYRSASVLAVTFTTRAAGELRGRLRMLGVPAVAARTFHSAALRQAQYFWPRAYGSELPGLVDSKMALVAEASSRLRLGADPGQLRDLSSEISWAKVSNVVEERYAALARREGRTVGNLEPEAVARVLARYEDLKRDRGRIDFDDILLCTASLLADRPEIAEEIRRTYRYLVVDEYQDVSPLQQTVLEQWLGDRAEVCVVGDPAQTIHSFAGARSDYLTGFTRRHPDAAVVRLVRDYRSTPQIVEVANAVMRHRSSAEPPSTAVALEPVRASGPAPQFVPATDEAAEAAAVADWVKGLRSQGVEYRQMALLTRVNAQSPPFEQALAERGVPYLVRGGERFYERAEVRRALGVLRAGARTGGGATGPPPDPAPPDPGPADTTVGGQVRAVLATVGWKPEPPSGSGAVRERWESLAALLTVADDVLAARPRASLGDVVVELEGRAAAQQVPAADGVTISTLHSAKGLEWRAVAIVGVHEGLLPFVLASTGEQIAEERRLFYVGVTRAAEHLRVSWSGSRSGTSGRRRPSRFLDGLIPSERRPVGPVPNRARGTSAAARCRRCGEPLHDAAERKLGRHADCPSSYDEATLDALRDWRREAAEAESLPAYCIITDATMTALAEAKPATAAGLLRVPGLGKVKVDKYGADVLRILAD